MSARSIIVEAPRVATVQSGTSLSLNQGRPRPTLTAGRQRRLGNTRPIWPYRLYHFSLIISLRDTLPTSMSQKFPEGAPFPASAEYIGQKNGRGGNRRNGPRRHPEEER
jgi:hypothetical protein